MSKPQSIHRSQDTRTTQQIADRLRRACLSVAPAFRLSEMVAVNPFLGFSEDPFHVGVERVEAIFHNELLPSTGECLEAWKNGDFCSLDFDSASAELVASLAVEGVRLDSLVRAAREEASNVRGRRILSVADQLDGERQLASKKALAVGLTRFLAARFDGGQASFAMPGQSLSLYSAYLQYAQLDRTPELAGLDGFRGFIKKASLDPLHTIYDGLVTLRVSPERQQDYLTRLFAQLPGYSSFVRQEAWQLGHEEVGELPELLAILILQDQAFHDLLSPELWPLELPAQSGNETNRLLRLTCLRAREHALARHALGRFRAPPVTPSDRDYEVQAVFCIDVRSERLRRHLEVEGNLRTYGFAGFFGLPISLTSSDGTVTTQCPPLLKSAYNLPTRTGDEAHLRWLKGPVQAIEQLKESAVSAFSYMETFGALFALPALVRDAFARPNPSTTTQGLSPATEVNLPLEARVALARGFLRGAGLKFPLAPVVALVGHGSGVSNNPQAAALACGACAGHSGAPNALIACRLLNSSDVRAALANDGLDLGETRFVACVHDTMTDVVTVLDKDSIAAEPAVIAKLEACFFDAGRRVRQERAGGLLGLTPSTDPLLELERRARDPAETRPEWALGGNAGFFIGRRERTRQVNLDGRFFLHSYDAGQDAEGSWLEQILLAPVVVGSWINLQYFASASAPAAFGSGRKTLHNIVGRFGVVEGNEGDLKQGLSNESISNGWKRMHEPLRLQVLIEADPAVIAGIIRKHESLQRLINGGWLALYAVDPSGNDVSCYVPDRGFQVFQMANGLEGRSSKRLRDLGKKMDGALTMQPVGS